MSTREICGKYTPLRSAVNAKGDKDDGGIGQKSISTHHSSLITHYSLLILSVSRYYHLRPNT
ncbi:MAG: hypothetical protein F6K47_16035 [Symploca sp. SIO2E6]|nr:hypothetical protein [Symploca sp. SIO2E6]